MKWGDGPSCAVDFRDPGVRTRASPNFLSYLPHSGLQSEWSGPVLVAVSEGLLENPEVYSHFSLCSKSD